MAPKESKKSKKAPEEEEGGEEEAKEPEKPLKKETGAQIVHNLLEKKRISTPHPQAKFLKWTEWTCLHCNETYYPAQRYDVTEIRDSDITSPIVKHFSKKHGAGPNSAWAECAPNTYKLVDARHSEEGEILAPRAVRRAFG